MKLKIPAKQLLHYALPSIISLGVLFIMSYFLKGTLGGEGASTTIVYVMALFIAGGYFFISAVLLYLMKLLKVMIPSKKEKLEDLEKQRVFLKGLKKNIEKRYYFKKDIDEATFRHELQEIARREIEMEEKLAQMGSIQKEENSKKNTRKKIQEDKK